MPVTGRTALVIEGFPRCANTYAYTAFWIANGRDLEIAHHTHAASAVVLGARRRLPVVVLVRPPLEAVASWLVFRPELTAREALAAYLRFYRAALRVRDRVVVAPFDVVVGDFSQVIEAVNRRFGTSFAPYEATPENEARIRHEAEWWDYAIHRSIDEGRVSRPSAERAEQKAARQAEIRAQTDLLRRATDVYEQLAARPARMAE